MNKIKMRIFSRILKNKRSKDKDARIDHVDLLYLIGRLSVNLGQEFHRKTINKQECFLSTSRDVAVYPPGKTPAYASGLRETDIKDLQAIGEYTGVLGGTFVRTGTLRKVIESLEKDNIPYTFHINRVGDSPLLIRTSEGNIIITHMMRSKDITVFEAGG